MREPSITCIYMLEVTDLTQMLILSSGGPLNSSVTYGMLLTFCKQDVYFLIAVLTF